MKNRFQEIVVSGTNREMGLQIGDACRETIKELASVVLHRFNLGQENNVSIKEAREISASALNFSRSYLNDEIQELIGISESSGVSLNDLMLLNCRNMFSVSQEGCTAILVSDERSDNGYSIAGQNWDNDPEMDKYSVVLTRRPVSEPSNITWTQPGLSAYMGFNSAGTAVCMNALNGGSTLKGIPWYFIVRKLLKTAGFFQAIDNVRRMPRAITANAAIITSDGPINIELTPESVEYLEPKNGLIVHTNHCLHPKFKRNNIEFKKDIYGQSFERKDRCEEVLSKIDQIKIEDVKRALSDHEGFPTSICRHPNPDPLIGWQRSVISIIMQPITRELYISRGNPCESNYEVYQLD
ncbi:MAG: peptidase C45 [SAR202 cluster bacterium]|jgi:isopenicillin-N N-acyltransferase-like protein|nr:peptidase C45 [Chloroflexota bacterium]MDP7231404.1 C45 family autoproteolytic acyltransferase/hydrolase [Dehalococcoidia bacterium]MDP7613257.1 C45 family autoproteolytic acyltransferase/hydrolase [Dehalococcoidia bacterium]MQG46771.1 peptidase C45 [SAR202 cluster bacterium]|tara:strand:- start:795 stop:1856 length:1062 start_codon:yes stop_codon:yes gene_type:complete